MIVRCYTCGKVLRWLAYWRLIHTMAPADAMTTLGYQRYCCRAHLLSEPDIEDRQLSADRQLNEAVTGMSERVTFLEPDPSTPRVYNAR